MTMRHLTLICMAGISTSLLVNKLKRLIRNENLEIAVTAMSERAFQGYTGLIRSVSEQWMRRLYWSRHFQTCLDK